MECSADSDELILMKWITDAGISQDSVFSDINSFVANNVISSADSNTFCEITSCTVYL